jgi:hypothetical protein
MRVFDLGCEQGHRFEGWFRSAEDYQKQQSDGQLVCPLCGSSRIEKHLSAPRLNLGPFAANEAPAGGNDLQSGGTPARTEPAARPERARALADDARQSFDPQAMQALWLQMVRHVIATTEDVGREFASEARRIRDEEAPQRPIRGVASAEETRELKDEGIEVFALPIPKDLLGPLQ